MGRAILYGGLVVGTLDALDALIFFGLRGVAPIRIGQSIAAGVLGALSRTVRRSKSRPGAFSAIAASHVREAGAALFAIAS